MTLTRIGDNNFDAFKKILPFTTIPKPEENILLLGAIEDGRAAAAGALSLSEETAVIESLYVLSEFRRRGIGGAIIKEFKDIAKGVEIPSLSVDFSKDEALKAFFEKEDFFVVPGAPLYYAKLSDLKDSKYIKIGESRLKNYNIKSLSELEGSDGRKLGNLIANTLDMKDYGKLNPDKDFSRVMFDSNNMPVAYLFISLLDDAIVPESGGKKAFLVSMMYSRLNRFQELFFLFASALFSDSVKETGIETAVFYSTDKVRDFAAELLVEKPLSEAVINYTGVFDTDI